MHHSLAALSTLYSFLSRQQQITLFNPEDFTFSLGGPEPDAPGNGAQLRFANLNQLPALEGQGISMVVVNLDPCGINLPHVHPRATEVSHRAIAITVAGVYLRWTRCLVAVRKLLALQGLLVADTVF